MQGYDAKDMALSFRTVRDNTIRVAEDIPEEHYGYHAVPEVKSVAQTLAHIAVAPRFPMRMHGARVTAADYAMFVAAMQRQAEEEAQLTTKAQILDSLRTGGKEFADWLEALSDETLAERVSFPAPVQPPSKSRLEMLLATKEHEMHHRAQLMVVERLLGIVPHLTRDFEARRAQFQAQPSGASPA